jgi:hypothetical protein
MDGLVDNLAGLVFGNNIELSGADEHFNGFAYNAHHDDDYYEEVEHEPVKVNEWKHDETHGNFDVNINDVNDNMLERAKKEVLQVQSNVKSALPDDHDFLGIVELYGTCTYQSFYFLDSII